MRDLKQSALAMRLEVHEMTVSRWECGKSWPTLRQQVRLCEVLKVSAEELGLSGPPSATHRSQDPPLDCGRTPPPPLVLPPVGVADALSLTAWMRSTNTSDAAIEYLSAVTSAAAQDHTHQPPRVVLAKVLRIHWQIQALLQRGRQRLGQSRELFRIDAELLAHVCLLLGDVHRDEAAAAYGAAAMLAAEEGGFSPAEALSAQAQIARWRHRYTDAADLAAEGYASSPQTSIRVLLACQEANAAALAGDSMRAHQALARAEAIRVDDDVYSAWSCPPARHALYRLGVALHSGDPARALHEATTAEAAWVTAQPRAFGSWAHTRIAAGIAHLLLTSLDGAVEQITPVFDLSIEYRLATLTEHLATVDLLLRRRCFRGASQTTHLRDRIAEFTRSASTTGDLGDL
jgi:transcriptional regulator with XRE-family HTH domain